MIRLSAFQMGSNGPAFELVLQQLLKVPAEEVDVAAAKAKTIPLHRGYERVDGAKFGCGRLVLGVAEASKAQAPGTSAPAISHGD
jgi:hypothetical protein